jgi:hypothetical protein
MVGTSSVLIKAIIYESEISMNTSILYETVKSKQQTGMATKTLLAFLALTFGLSWVPMSLFILFLDPSTALFGERWSSF